MTTTHTLDRIPAARALRNVRALCRKLAIELAQPQGEGCGDLGPARVGIVGSLRRGCPTVHDVDLLAPLPESGRPDVLYEAIRTLFGDAKAANKNPLFSAVAAPGSAWGEVTSGLSEGFKKLTIEVPTPGDPHHPDAGWAQPFKLKIEVHRYTPGLEGNRGWIEMIRTGPGGKDDQIGFGEMMLIRWKRRNPGGRSIDGWPCYQDGSRHHVQDEAAAFRAVGLNWIPPHERTLANAKLFAGSGRTA